MSLTVTNAVWDRGPKGMGCKLVLLAIARRLKEHDMSGTAWPGVSRLAADCGADDRTIQRSLRQLEEGGWIQVERGGGRAPGKGQGATNRYRINLAKLGVGPASDNPGNLSGLENQPRQSVQSTPAICPINPGTVPPEQEMKYKMNKAGSSSCDEERELHPQASAQAEFWAAKIRDGKFVASSSIKAALAREMVAARLVSEAELRAIGIAV